MTVLKSTLTLPDWKIDSIHRNYKLVNRIQSINDGRMNRMRFYFVKKIKYFISEGLDETHQA